MLQDFAISAAAAFIVCWLTCRALMRGGPIDMPTIPRKAHGVPTPTIGGVGIAVGVGMGLVALAMISSSWRHVVSEEGADLISIGVAFAYGFAILGFVDDVHPLGARLKFAVFIALAVGAAISVGVVIALPLWGGVSLKLPYVIGLLGTALWIFTLVNCVNFMDGANGLSMGSVAVGLFVLGAIAYAHYAPSGAALAFCGAGALLGFLVWNAPKGRVFAGDSGALFIGAVAALASLIIIRRTGLSPLVPPIIFFPLLADVLLTLAWRARRGRSLLEGHAEHTYQIALRSGWSHMQVAMAYWAAMAVCGGIAYVSLDENTPTPAMALTALAAAALAASYAVRRYAARRGILEG